MKLMDAIPLLERLLFSFQSVELRSGPGVGKSSAVEQVLINLSKKTGHPFGLVTCMLAGYDSPEVKGFLIPKEDQIGPDGKPRDISKYTLPDWMPQAHNTMLFVDGQKLGYVQDVKFKDKDGNEVPAEVPQFGVVFFDEFMQADHSVQKPAADILLNRRCGYYHLPEHWSVWAASNRTKDRSGVQRDLAFIQNRRMLVEIEPDLQSWQVWAETHGVHPVAIRFAAKNPDIVFMKEVPDVDGPYCTPRSLVLGTEMLDRLRKPDSDAMKLPTDIVAKEALRGWIGEGAMVQFMVFAELADGLPDIEEIENDPDGADVPENPAAQMLMAQMVAHSITRDNCGPLVRYVKRLRREVQGIMVDATIRRDSSLLNTHEFSMWVAENQDLLNASLGGVKH